MNIKQIKYNDIKETTWSGGTTKEYYIYPENASYDSKEFLVRLSAAIIEDTKPFTNFIGYKRYFTMLDNSIELSVNGTQIDKERLQVITFNSEDDVTSYSLGTDLNLMVKEDIPESNLFVDNGFMGCEDDFIFIVALFEQTVKVNNQDYVLDYLDALVIENTSREKVDIFAPFKVMFGRAKLPYQI